MTATLAQLYSHLKSSQPLKPIYLLAGDVILLQQEARAALRHAAQEKGFSERVTTHIASGFDWKEYFGSLQNYQLFSENSLHELNYPNAKFDKEVTQVLIQYLENPAQDKILLLITAKLTSAQQKTKWYQAIDAKGLAVDIRPVSKGELPQWIATRAQQAQLTFTKESILLLAELTEGNLVATQQAIEKLKLLYPQQKIDPSALMNVIHDSAQFNIFDLGNHMLANQISAALRCMHGLKDSGTEPTLILWAITREIRELLNLLQQQQNGIPLAELLQRQWQSRRALLKQALSKTSIEKLHRLLSVAEKTDRIIKGARRGKPWEALETLILSFANHSMHAL